ncbi:DEAD/DEAH box helicase [Metabacillus sp. FJAT-52054]|uniref:DEAD/DEAH box helicase n=1 Tax=Metabacillus sediminis TaxID=3117746 RepID=A0ABZ2NJ21_9BACI
MSQETSFIQAFQPFIQEAWKQSEFPAPTSVQAQSVQPIMENKDVLAKSPTGSGKTLAYLLPVLEKLNAEGKQPQAVILASSHELVMQIHSVIQEWIKGSELRTASFIGGANPKRQLEKLKKNPHIISGTPGKVLELIKMKKLKMHEVKTIVLDEGDQLLVPEHMKTIGEVIKSTQRDRQLLLYSATLSPKTEEMAAQMMNEPVKISVDREQAIKSEVRHLYIVSEQRDKLKALEKIMRAAPVKTLAFMKDIGSVNVAAEKLAYDRMPVSILHSESGKTDREAALRKFRKGDTPLLIATDVAARGLDIQDLEQVVHLDFPEDIDQFVHRSGRTGRLGSKTNGNVISLVTEREERELKQYAKKLGIELERNVLFGGNILTEEERLRNGRKR